MRTSRVRAPLRPSLLHSSLPKHPGLHEKAIAGAGSGLPLALWRVSEANCLSRGVKLRFARNRLHVRDAKRSGFGAFQLLEKKRRSQRSQALAALLKLTPLDRVRFACGCGSLRCGVCLTNKPDKSSLARRGRTPGSQSAPASG